MNQKALPRLLTAAVLGLALSAFLSAGVKIRVTADRVNVRQTSQITAPAVGRAEKGQVFTVVQKEGDWYLIQMPDGTPGYLHSFTVEEVTEGGEVQGAKPAPAPGLRRVQVTADRANIRKAAVLSAPLILAAEKGRVFPVVEKEGDWYLIQLADGTPGYIHSFTVAEVARGQAPPAVPKAEKPVEIPLVSETKPETFVKKTEEAVVPPVISEPAAPAPTPLKPVAAAGLPGKPRDSFSMFLLRAGYFIAADTAYTDVYQNGLIYGAELRIGGRKLAGWLDGTYRAETGELTYTKEKTEVSVLAVQAGLLYRFAAGTLNPYAGAGVGYFMFKEKNEAIGRAEKNQAGFCLVGGVSWIPGGGFVVDVRLKYEFCKMKPADFDIELGGLTAGLGIGFRF